MHVSVHVSRQQCFLTPEPTGTLTAAQMDVYNASHGINDHMMRNNKTQKGKKNRFYIANMLKEN